MKLARKLLAVLLAMALCPLMCAGAEEALPEAVEAAPAETPADIPEAEALPEANPETETPSADDPQTDIPETEAPDADTPQTDIPEADIPETEAPDTPATEAPTAEPTATPDPFASAKIKVERVGGGELRIGGELTLEAKVTGVGVKCELIWLACARDAVPVNGKLPWEALRPEVKGERCSIMLTEESVKLRYAAEIVGTDIMGTYDLPPVLPAATEEPEAPEAVQPLPELDKPLFSVTEGGIMPNDEDKPDAVHPLPELDHPLFNVTEDGIVPAPEDDKAPDDKPVQPDDKPAEKPVVPEPTSPADDEEPPQYEYERDENGELMLDADGNPIPVQFIPPSSQSVRTLEDLLDPNRSIEIFADWGGGALHYGDELTLTAVLHGYDNAVYSLQWQRSADDASWEDIQGETALTYAFTVTESNAADFWRVSVTITDATPGEKDEVS